VRLVQFVVGFVLGAATAGAAELLIIFLIMAMFQGRYEPTGIGWFIAPAVFGLGFGRAAAEETARWPVNVWFLASFLWLAAVGLYYWYAPHDRSGETLLTFAAIAYLPALLSFIGLLVYLRLRRRSA
jgi:hypothetical protein